MGDDLWTTILGVALGVFLGKLLWVFFQVFCKRQLERFDK